jgi:hypothetical protein
MKYAAIITIIYTVGGVVLFALSKAAANGDALMNRKDANATLTKKPRGGLALPRATLTLPQLLAVGRALKRV